MQKLPESELDVMLALWEADEMVPRSFLDERLRHKSWNVNTVNTYLTRLQDRGFVSCERRGRTNYYAPLVDKSAYLEFEGSALLQKLYGNSLKNFIASLSGSSSIGKEDLSELQQYLEQLMRGE